MPATTCWCPLIRAITTTLSPTSPGEGTATSPGQCTSRNWPKRAPNSKPPLPTEQLAYLDLPLGTGGKQCGTASLPCPKVTLTADFSGALQTWEGRIVRSEGKLGVLYAVAEVPNPYTQKAGYPPLLAGLFVQARVDPQKADINAIYAGLETGALKDLRLNYPGLSISIGQERQEQQAMTEALGRYTLISLLVIYVLIAVPFRSYLKPLIFLLTAPVAWFGAVIAHGWRDCRCRWNRWSA